MGGLETTLGHDAKGGLQAAPLVGLFETRKHDERGWDYQSPDAAPKPRDAHTAS